MLHLRMNEYFGGIHLNECLALTLILNEMAFAFHCRPHLRNEEEHLLHYQTYLHES